MTHNPTPTSPLDSAQHLPTFAEIAGMIDHTVLAPNSRRDEVRQQLNRPAFSRVAELGIRYLSYSELQQHRGAIARFGTGLGPMLQISEQL